MLKGGCGAIPHPLFFRLCLAGKLGFLAALLALAPLPGRAEIVFEAVPAAARWPDATAPGALRLACSRSVDELERHFLESGQPFRPELTRTERERVCHVFYEPTVPGFRATPDDDPLREILFDSDSLLYLATSRNRGEPVGALREILGRIPRPLDVSVLLHREHDETAYAAATRRAFGQTPHRVTLLERGVKENFWWVQDYVKSGASPRGETLLVPHRLFEGRPENGGVFEPLLEQLTRRPRVVRSRLSWEGGDLQFTRDPGDARRLVLYYGSFAKPYWGESLSAGEFEYVLAREFGADRAVDLGGLAPHVDYFVSFLARERTALVSMPRSSDLEVARGALGALLGHFASREPAALLELQRSLSSPAPDRSRIAAHLAEARRQQAAWDFNTDGVLADRMKSLVARVCPSTAECFSAANLLRLMDADPALFEEWLQAVQYAKDEQAILTAHLDVVESQLEPVPADVERRTADKMEALRALGFRTIEVPAFRVDLATPRDWPGISYVNGLVVDRQVFLPRFGLGDVEDRIFRDTGAQLPPGYAVVPIDAQRVLIRNGGLHCLTGLVRSPTP
jgi:hypothetical protein